MTQKAIAEAHANLAFVKYWGKKDSSLRLPTNNSISVNLSDAKTTTSVEFKDGPPEDILLVSGLVVEPNSDYYRRVIQHIDLIRQLAGITKKATIQTNNSFPSGIGIASSASGFAALTIAACFAAGLNYSEKELSILARLGSGSACRSIPSGFTEWLAGNSNESSYAVQIAPSSHWPIKIISVVVSRDPKRISSTSGHALAPFSPFFQTRLETLKARVQKVRSAILEKDFQTFGRETEQEAISFHSIAMTSPIQDQSKWMSGAYYWLPDSLELILAVQKWRNEGLDLYFTLDAGPTVHLICESESANSVIEAVRNLESRIPGRQWDLLYNEPAQGAHLIQGKDQSQD
jgi:diphosphomevalonate decarboxylase